MLALLKNRGRRECRVHAAPAVSCAVSAKGNAHEHTGEAEAVRHPLRSGFTAYIALSSGNGLSCPRRRAEQFRTTWRQRRGAGTTRLRRTQNVPFVLRHIRVHRSPAPRFVTIAMRPSCGGGMERNIHRSLFPKKRNIFRRRAGQTLFRQILATQLICPTHQLLTPRRHSGATRKRRARNDNVDGACPQNDEDDFKII